MKTPEHAPTWATSQKQRTVQLALWTGAWVISTALATFGPLRWWPHRPAVAVAAILLNVAVGIGMVLANRRHLQSLDELQQRIQLEAMGVTLGVGLVVGIALSTLEAAAVIPFRAEIAQLIVVMALTYIAAVLVGTKRYA